MVQRKKVSLSLGGQRARSSAAAPPPEPETLELFFNTGILYHEVILPRELPDVIASFVEMKDAAGTATGVRRAGPGEDPDVEVSAIEAMGDVERTWVPIPYQLSCMHCVQLYLARDARNATRALLAIDTLETEGAGGRHLDAKLDESRPFRPLEPDEISHFLEHATTREWLRKLERRGVESTTFKLAALLELLGPYLPRLLFASVESRPSVPVSLVLDLGNSRSTAVLVEAREQGLFALPLELRSSSHPLELSAEPFDSRITFVPGMFDAEAHDVAVADGYIEASVARLGREALDRALETPHRFLCTLSGPKRYLWDGEPTDERWHFAPKVRGEYRPVFGRLLKYIVEEAGGLELRREGPSTPPDPRYAPRSMMLFALAEIIVQAMAQINSVGYRRFQGKEGNPRVLKHLVLTHPSGMADEEKQVYEHLIQNACTIVAYLFNIHVGRRPNTDEVGNYARFLFTDEALAAQMVYLYQEVSGTFAGSMEELVRVFGKDGAIRIGSVDIGGGTTDVMVAEYRDKLAGTGTALSITKLFQDGVNIAGDEVCRAIIEDVIFAQMLSQLESHAAKEKLVHLFAEGDAGHGAAWRTLKAKLVPYFWLPLARCFWAVAEGFDIPDHSSDKHYSVEDIFEVFAVTSWSSQVIGEVDHFLGSVVPGFPGLRNFFFRFDRAEVDRTVEGVLREPLRRYADILAQFDIDVLIIAGRTSALPCIREQFIAEMPVAPHRIVSMNDYKVGDWYPSRWRENGRIRDPKTTVTAGATVLHLADQNQLSGFLLDDVTAREMRPIYGLYQETEPHVPRASELFRDGPTSEPLPYTHGMKIGFRNIDSEEMEGSPLFEVRPRTKEIEAALLSDRVSLVFQQSDDGHVSVREVRSERGKTELAPEDFELRLKTVTTDRYWLDTGVFKSIMRLL